MRTQLPVGRLVVVAVTAVAAIALFLFLNNSFGGPQVPPRDPYVLRATFPDSQNMVKKSLVMIRGVKVGEVTDVEVVRGKANVEFTVFDKYRPVREGATAQVGHRTVFGEAIVRLVRGRRDGRELESGSQVAIVPTVQPDEALQAIGPESRRNLTKAARGLARALRHPRAAERLSATYTGIWDTTENLRRFTDALKGQEAEIARLVSNSATVVGVLGRREAQLRDIVTHGRTVTETWARQAAAVGEGVDELHGMLGQARVTLANARPLMEEIAVAADRSREPARDLRPGFDGLAPIVATGRRIVESLKPANRFAQPTLRRAGALFGKLVPISQKLSATLGNLVPLFGYLAEHRGRYGAFIANTADTVDNGDPQANWLHGFLILDPRAGLAQSPGCENPSGGLCSNAYPAADGPAKLRPYERGDFPRLKPYMP